MSTPTNLRYSRDHKWIRLDGHVATIGLTEYASKQLDEIVFVKFPRVGDKLAQDEAFGAVESEKAVSELYAPVSGTIKELNTQLSDSPELINDVPYGEGWIIKMIVDNTEDVKSLLDAASYDNMIKEDAEG